MDERIIALALGKGPSPSRMPAQSTEKAATPFEWVGIDIIGALPKGSGGHTHILVLVEYLPPPPPRDSRLTQYYRPGVSL